MRTRRRIFPAGDFGISLLGIAARLAWTHENFCANFRAKIQGEHALPFPNTKRNQHAACVAPRLHLMNKRRPKNLNLLTIRQPVPAVVSILHRISGAVLFLLIPLILWAWQASLASEESFARLGALLGHPFSKLVAIVLGWAFLHHFFAGIRYLLIDLNYGVELKPARATSAAVLALSLVLTLVLAISLW